MHFYNYLLQPRLRKIAGEEMQSAKSFPSERVYICKGLSKFAFGHLSLMTWHYDNAGH